MIGALVLLVLAAVPASAQWTGTIAGRPVSCAEVGGPAPIAPTGGDAAVVTTLGLWCRGTPRHTVSALVYVTDKQGDLAITGHLCRRGPRPHRQHAPLAHCCPLGGGTFTGDFRPAYPPDEQTAPVEITLGTLTSVQLGASCRHVTFPVGTVDLHAPTGTR
jgi:hypothetical protein